MVKVNENGKVMKRLLNLFTTHPNSIGETYVQHFFSATRISGRLGIACLSQITHAVFPFIHPPMSSDVKSLIKFLKEADPKSRSQTTTNYEEFNDYFGSD